MQERLLESMVVIDHVPSQNVTSAGDLTTAGQDTTGYQGEATAIINVGAMGSGAKLDGKLQECDTSGGLYTDITGGAMVQKVAASHANTCASVSVRLGTRANRKKFIKFLPTITATTGVQFSVTLLLTGAEKQPVVNSPVSVLA